MLIGSQPVIHVSLFSETALYMKLNCECYIAVDAHYRADGGGYPPRGERVPSSPSATAY